MRNQSKNKVTIVGLSIFILSLFFNAFTVEDMGKIKNYTSFEVFLIGPVSFLGGAGKEFLVWTANIWFLISLFCVFKKYHLASFITGTVAFVISGSFIFLEEILAAENGRIARIYSLDAGYFLWLASILFITLSAGYLRIVNKKDAHSE
ncbi:hypothetical protein SD427_14000 [Chryseobacterium sp. JJR-5R]|uniref:hypothetical protein n=1 Tax=Chryseobacterium sp. JJR-5R TaxID=3093923 RepID=UPI002A7495E6|nr:hypothetical protein [Chryseobacterium sp. JJR-5R]WPO81873.1 hypothetical protein SD427_14000 [Chryseobacterium sp. JJR-5R]